MANKYEKRPASRFWTMSEARQAVLMYAQQQANLRRSLRAILESERDYQRQRTGDRNAVAPVPPAPDERKSRPTPVD